MTGRTRNDASALGALLAGVCAALVSCNLVVGVGDYSVGSSEADGATDGMGVESSDGTGDVPVDQGPDGEDARAIDENTPDANGEDSADAQKDVAVDSPMDGASAETDAHGHADSAIDADAGADADSSVDAGADADADSSVDAGADSAVEAAANVTCGEGLPTTPDFARLVSTCTLAVTCDPYFFTTNISTCITYDYLEATPSLSCLTSVANCDDYFACVGWRYAAESECIAPGAASCGGADGNLAIDCTNSSALIATDCTHFGQTCGMYATENGGLGVGCVAPTTCDMAMTADTCSSNYLIEACPTGVAYGENCTALQSTCKSVGDSGADCYSNAPSCADPYTYSCASTGLTYCTEANQSLGANCGRAGLSCALDDAGSGYCVAPGCPIPPPSSCVESCSGHTLSVCVGGAPYSIDCSQYGYSGCDTATDSSGITYAYCQ
jgi:hypothetical protein